MISKPIGVGDEDSPNSLVAKDFTSSSQKQPLAKILPSPSVLKVPDQTVAPNSLCNTLLKQNNLVPIVPLASSKPLWVKEIKQSKVSRLESPSSSLFKTNQVPHQIKKLLPNLEDTISLHGSSMKILNRSLVYPKKARFSALDILPESASHIAFSSPLAVGSFKISSPFGKRRDPWKGCTRMHNGLDLEAPYGTPVLAAASGTVEKISKSRHGYGNHVCLVHTNGYRTIYGHLSFHALHLKPGMRIQRGSLLGYVGSTGRSTGNHLHFEIRKDGQPRDPARILEGLRGIV